MVMKEVLTIVACVAAAVVSLGESVGRATSVPVTGTRDRPREIPGLVFGSDVK